MKKVLLGLTFLFASIGLSAAPQLFPRHRAVVVQSAFLPVPGVAPTPMQPPAAPVEGAFGASKKLGPVACAAVRMHLRKEYRKQGLGIVESISKANEATDAVINGLVPDAEKVAGASVAGAKFGAIGDGTLIQAIIEFFKSPQGQALIKALIDMIIHMLAVDVVQPHVDYTLHLDQRDTIYTFSPNLAA